MKRSDWLFILLFIVLFTPLIVCKTAYEFFTQATASHPYLMAFLKFAILSSAGEMLGLRIKEGRYNYKGFGLAPRAIVWGLLGVWIAAAMKKFSTGAPILIESIGFEGVAKSMTESFSLNKLIGAFAISVAMNTSFAPVFMTCHKVTDTHILENNGSLRSLIRPLAFGKILCSINWQVQWNFVFKKTIPLFWIPAHTITFLLPPTFQVLFASLLGVALGVILSTAAIKSRS